MIVSKPPKPSSGKLTNLFASGVGDREDDEFASFPDHAATAAQALMEYGDTKEDEVESLEATLLGRAAGCPRPGVLPVAVETTGPSSAPRVASPISAPKDDVPSGDGGSPFNYGIINDGGAKYYSSKETDRCIYTGVVMWSSNKLQLEELYSFVDTEKSSDSDVSYFMSLQSGFLPKRLGLIFTMEPYNPHHFAQQFGYIQDVPGIAVRDLR
ncbi:hypothetical protein LIER_26469 [Lithospermum erythrorhizon]|uniref:Uncharacterized protein n=1 Tax=Lithospermum erythrorhizon TaxID=34254 RepID=A0AAV3RCQ1_LITER